MKEEDAIFGPFNLKQTVSSLICLAVAYVGYRILPAVTGYALIVAGITAAIVCLFRFNSKTIPFAELDRYFKIKKAELSPDAYMQYLQKKHAAIISQIDLRKKNGFMADPDLAQADQKFRELISRK